MSSDESNHEGRKGEATYHIREKRWCSRRVNDWLRMLDALHLRLRYSGKWQATAGAWPHFRSPGLEYSKRPPVKGLPINFYSADWYGNQDAFTKGQLKAEKQLGSLNSVLKSGPVQSFAFFGHNRTETGSNISTKLHNRNHNRTQPVACGCMVGCDRLQSVAP